jgi:hypothetical protein
LRQDLKIAIKAKEESRKVAIRVVLGELGRLETKEVSDDDVIRVLKKLVKSEKELLEKTGRQESDFMGIVEGYLPGMAGEKEIRAWIMENIDFSKYKNKMKAMGEIMKHFGSHADGTVVKQILQNL